MLNGSVGSDSKPAEFTATRPGKQRPQGFATIASLMSPPPDTAASTPIETLHGLALGAAALGLLLGLLASKVVWVNLGVSLILLLPPLRLATTIVAEGRGGRQGTALMGIVVLVFLLISRRFS